MAAQQIYVNLPVSDLKVSVSFFRQLGFDFDMKFTNDDAACLILGENIYAMLLRKDFFKGFTKKAIVNAHEATEVLVAFSVSSRKEVDELIAKAKKSGGKVLSEPSDHGFMYLHGFEDLDGHIWEVLSYEQK